MAPKKIQPSKPNGKDAQRDAEAWLVAHAHLLEPEEPARTAARRTAGRRAARERQRLRDAEAQGRAAFAGALPTSTAGFEALHEAWLVKDRDPVDLRDEATRFAEAKIQLALQRTWPEVVWTAGATANLQHRFERAPGHMTRRAYLLRTLDRTGNHMLYHPALPGPASTEEVVWHSIVTGVALDRPRPPRTIRELIRLEREAIERLRRLRRQPHGDVAALVAAAGGPSAAARVLGVSRRTIHRWTTALTTPPAHAVERLRLLCGELVLEPTVEEEALLRERLDR